MREFLKGLDFDDETVDTIMAEYGKHITKAKEEISDLKDALEKANQEKEQFQKQITENEESLKNYQDLTNENKSLKAQIELKDSNVKKEFSKFVTSEIMSNVNDDVDFTKALENYKKENPQYFGETVVKKVQTSPNLNGGIKETTTNDIMNDIIRNSVN